MTLTYYFYFILFKTVISGWDVTRCNPGSIVKVKVDDMQGKSVFSRFYTCFKACKDAFVVCCSFI